MREVDAIKLVELAGFVIGAVLLTYGIGQWSTPGGYVTAGILLIGVAIWPARKPEKAGR